MRYKGLKMKLIILCALVLISCGQKNTDIEKKKETEIEKPEEGKSIYTISKKYKGNWGHRIGGDVIKGKSIRQNTLKVLKIALNEKIHEHKKFKYWEFDVRETLDNVLIVHHDRELHKKRKQYIDKLTYAEVIAIKPDIPTYKAVMRLLNEKFMGSVAVEIKSIISDTGRRELIKEVDDANAKGNLQVKYLAFPNKFKKSFPKKERKFWCKKMKFVMRARIHKINLCK